MIYYTITKLLNLVHIHKNNGNGVEMEKTFAHPISRYVYCSICHLPYKYFQIELFNMHSGSVSHEVKLHVSFGAKSITFLIHF